MQKTLNLNLDRNSVRALHRQLYDELKRMIIDGELPPGFKMPSSRELSAQFKIARSTATSAYDQLLADGFFQTYSGTGTFVSRDLPAEALVRCQQPQARADDSSFSYELSDYGDFLSKQPDFTKRGRLLRGGAVAFDEFPIQDWKRLILRRTRALNSSTMEYPDDAAGYPPLKAAIAAYLSDARGVKCKSSQILITNGSQQAVDLIGRIHLRPGDRVALEDPGYFLAQKTFAAYGAELVPIPVDGSGLITQHLSSLDGPVKLLYTTPSHQFPLGGTLPLSRRLVLLEWAHNIGAVLVEDDYDSEFRFSGRPLSALQSLDQFGSVIYTGSFSKVLFPALRLAYIVVPEPLLDVYIWAKRLSDHFSPLLPQMVLSDFINEGLLQKHIDKMRTIYGAKRQLLISLLQQHFQDTIQIIGENAGLHLAVRFHIKADEQQILAAAEAAQLPFRTTESTYMKALRPSGEFVLSYSNLSPDAITEGVTRLAANLKTSGE